MFKNDRSIVSEIMSRIYVQNDTVHVKVMSEMMINRDSVNLQRLSVRRYTDITRQLFPSCRVSRSLSGSKLHLGLFFIVAKYTPCVAVPSPVIVLGKVHSSTRC